MITFDLDGVLLDTEPIIREAYKRAGVDPGPVDVMSVGWGKWLIPRVGDESEAARIHHAKDQIYLDLVGDAAFLPPLKWILDRDSRFRIYQQTCIVTGAPVGTASRLYGRIGLGYFYCTYEAVLDKKSMLSYLSHTGIHVDDQPIDVPDGWRLHRWQKGEPWSFA